MDNSRRPDAASGQNNTKWYSDFWEKCMKIKEWGIEHKDAVMMLVMGVFMYVMDVGSDILMSVKYNADGDKAWFILTLLFICTTSVCQSVLALVVLPYFEVGKMPLPGFLAKTKFWLQLLVMFQLGPIALNLIVWARAVQKLFSSPPPDICCDGCGRQCCSCCSTPRCFTRFKSWGVWKELSLAGVRKEFLMDILLYVKLIGAFFEDAPQLLLNVYVQLQEWQKLSYQSRPDKVSFQWSFSTGMAFISLSMAMSEFYKQRYSARHTGCTINMPYGVLIISWYALTIASRVMAMAFFAVVSPGWFFGLMLLHYVIMLAWLILHHTQYTKEKYSKGLYFFTRIFVAFSMIFTFYPISEFRQEAKYRTWSMYIFFYGLAYAEIVLMMLLWFFLDADKMNCSWCAALIVTGVLVAYPLGVGCHLVFSLLKSSDYFKSKVVTSANKNNMSSPDQTETSNSV